MHEINIVRQVVKTVSESAGEELASVREIVLDIGELSLVIPEYVEELYPAVVRGTALEGSKLVINVIPGLAECRECGEIFNVLQCSGYCPKCGGFEKDVLTGRDFYIRELHLE